MGKESLGYIARSIPIDLIETKKSLKKELRKRSEKLADFSSKPVFYFSGEENILNLLKGKKINYDLPHRLDSKNNSSLKDFVLPKIFYK